MSSLRLASLTVGRVLDPAATYSITSTNPSLS
jgi:hypothetical protein